jgi:eukaryotic-like serine/threonine-protein kinase
MKTCPICDFRYDDQLDECPRHRVELADTSDPLLGSIIKDRYKLVQLLGRGSMGAVYRAKTKGSASEVAIKVLHTHLANNRESLKRFHHEAKASSRLRHPHIVSIYDVGVIPNGQPYIAMELLKGRNLGQFLKERRQLGAREALPIIRQVCEALSEAHSHGVVHRDIKPANIMLMNRFGQEHYVVVVDFGIAKVIQRVSDVDSTTPGLIFGSPAYMSPERFRGKGGDFRSDIYSLGIIMFQMLTGAPPFRSGDLYSLMNEHVNLPPPSVRSLLGDQCDIPQILEDTIARALAKRPEDRQENMRQLLTQINQSIDATFSSTPLSAEELKKLVVTDTLERSGGHRFELNAEPAKPERLPTQPANIDANGFPDDSSAPYQPVIRPRELPKSAPQVEPQPAPKFEPDPQPAPLIGLRPTAATIEPPQSENAAPAAEPPAAQQPRRAPLPYTPEQQAELLSEFEAAYMNPPGQTPTELQAYSEPPLTPEQMLQQQQLAQQQFEQEQLAQQQQPFEQQQALLQQQYAAPSAPHTPTDQAAYHTATSVPAYTPQETPVYASGEAPVEYLDEAQAAYAEAQAAYARALAAQTPYVQPASEQSSPEILAFQQLTDQITQAASGLPYDTSLATDVTPSAPFASYSRSMVTQSDSESLAARALPEPPGRPHPESVRQKPPDSLTTGNFSASAIRRDVKRSGQPQGKESVALLHWAICVGAVILVIAGLMHLPTGPRDERANQLINQGKLDDAGHVLQLWRAEGKLSQRELEDVDALCLKLAKEYAKNRRYRPAVVYLEQISSQTRYSAEARALARRYRRLL